MNKDLAPIINKNNGVSILNVMPEEKKAASKKVNNQTQYYLNDAGNPDLVGSKVPPLPNKTFLPMRSIGDIGPGYALGTPQQQASALQIVVNDTLSFLASKSPKSIKNWPAVKTLTLISRAGKDINAYYDRSSLKFFYFGDPVLKKNIYACDSHSVVSHELGHAFLDMLRPDYWNSQSLEVWALHEAFGDLSAALHYCTFDSLIDRAISETNSDLLKSNIITRLAAQMGQGLYHITGGEYHELPNCLRDMTQVFYYVEPETLPSEGYDDQLLSECHSFARVFTGAFWKILVKCSELEASQGKTLKQGVKIARDSLHHTLLAAIYSAPKTIRLFDAVAKNMLAIDLGKGGKYKNIMLDVFTEWRILRQAVRMLSDQDAKDFISKNKGSYETHTLGNVKILKTNTHKTLKLKDHLQNQVSILSNNPLYNLEIDVPFESAYYFEDDKLIDFTETSETEAIDGAFKCLDILHSNNLVGSHQNALFHSRKNKLVRKQFACRCNRPNYCDPNAPEYNKPWKPANNSGCSHCYGKDCKPQSCDCKSPPKPVEPKIGCYTKTYVGKSSSYKFGSTASRRVC